MNAAPTKAQQKLTKFRLAVTRLAEALTEDPKATSPVHDLLIDGTIQRFEFTYEISWKALKDILEHEGIEARSPKSTFQQAFALGWIENEALWLTMIDDRNMTTHTYDEALAKEIYSRIKTYMPEFERICSLLENLNSKPQTLDTKNA